MGGGRGPGVLRVTPAPGAPAPEPGRPGLDPGPPDGLGRPSLGPILLPGREGASAYSLLFTRSRGYTALCVAV